jgi:low affinity Fe/Cu permease
MSPEIINALITGLCVAVPTIISVVVTSNTRDAVNEERIKNLSEKIDDLSAKVQVHNSFAERIAIVERDIKTCFNLLEQMRKEIHNG